MDIPHLLLNIKTMFKEATRRADSLFRFLLPFILVIGGVFVDYATTIIGLTMGFHEVNPQYNPVWALVVFTISTFILKLSLPGKRLLAIIVNGTALTSYLGAINNILLILGLHPGL